MTPFDDPDKVSRLRAQLDQISELLGGGPVFIVHRNAQGGYACAGPSECSLLDALEALGGGVCSVAITMHNQALQTIGASLVDIARTARRASAAQQRERRERAS